MHIWKRQNREFKDKLKSLQINMIEMTIWGMIRVTREEIMAMKITDFIIFKSYIIIFNC